MRRTVATHGPNPIDVQVGQQLRALRTVRGLSQENLADQVGMSFQQIQQYERGANRISASVLYALAGGLEVPVHRSFD